MKKVILVLGVASLLFTACGSSTNETSTEKKEVTSMMQKEEVNEGILVLNGGDDMKFDKTELRAKSGETVKLQLNHTGKMSKEAMGHNFVLLAEGTDFAAFASEAIKAKDTDYIPESMKEALSPILQLLAVENLQKLNLPLRLREATIFFALSPDTRP